jgi:GNAT superfamily N-acetyltransferase
VTELRRADSGDAPLLQLLAMETFLEAFSMAIPPRAMASLIETRFTLERIEAELAGGAASIFLVEEGGELAGYAAALPNGLLGTVGADAWELNRLYLRRHLFGRGLGDLLLKACLDDARGDGARSLWLKVWEGNGRGRAFYRRWGFEEIGREEMDIFGTVLPHLILEKVL